MSSTTHTRRVLDAVGLASRLPLTRALADALPAGVDPRDPQDPARPDSRAG